MANDQQPDFSRHDRAFRRKAPGTLHTLSAFVIGSVLFVLALTFSLVLFAVIAIGALLLWGYLRWKTRGRRQEAGRSAPTGGHVIEGQAVREIDPDTQRH